MQTNSEHMRHIMCQIKRVINVRQQLFTFSFNPLYLRQRIHSKFNFVVCLVQFLDHFMVLFQV
jgi:hypothetical protein